MITGKDLLAWGWKPGPHFKAALARAAELVADGLDDDTIRARLEAERPAAPAVLRRRAHGTYAVAIEATDDEDAANIAAVRAHMDALMTLPVIEQGVVMPDACPAGNAVGTIPVGGGVASRGIHPGFHSADICCSMHVSLYPDTTPAATFLDAVQAVTRFGPGGRRPEHWVADPITDEIEATRNPFLTGLAHRAKAQLADQGDGNHFAYLGRLTVDDALVVKLRGAGQTLLADAVSGHAAVLALVTHHGSRDLGAQVYKRGVEAAAAWTSVVCPGVGPHQSWLDPVTDQGELYWQALQYVARWTKRNHQLIHERTAARLGIDEVASFGNEHNFVWRRGDLFFHGKGATPAWHDEAGHPLLGVVPLNMAEPVLLTLGADNAACASFSPHGAGRNKSRTRLLRELGLSGLAPDAYLARSRQLLDEQTAGLDVRFFFDRPDVSETPMAYKSAATVRSQIAQFELADIAAEITPLGCIMAGDYDKPWLVAKAAKRAAAAAGQA